MFDQQTQKELCLHFGCCRIGIRAKKFHANAHYCQTERGGESERGRERECLHLHATWVGRLSTESAGSNISAQLFSSVVSYSNWNVFSTALVSTSAGHDTWVLFVYVARRVFLLFIFLAKDSRCKWRQALLRELHATAQKSRAMHRQSHPQHRHTHKHSHTLTHTHLHIWISSAIRFAGNWKYVKTCLARARRQSAKNCAKLMPRVAFPYLFLPL